MPVESDADRLALLEDWDVATIGGVLVNGIFNNAHTSVDGGEVAMSGSRPRFQCRTSDVTSVVTGTQVIQGGVTYTVFDIHHESGVEIENRTFTNLILRK